MLFIDDETNEKHKLYDSDELNAELQAHSRKFDCSHTFQELRRRSVAGGSIQIKNQCLECGRAIGNSVKKHGSHDTIPAFDETKVPTVENIRKSEYLAICRRHLNIQNKIRHHIKRNMPYICRRLLGRKNVERF